MAGPLWGLPESNCSIRISYECISKSKVKTDVKKLLSSISTENINIVLCRYCKTWNDVLVKLENVFVKLNILCNYMRHPSTFTISYDENISDCEIDQTYNSFCKYALGISKYTIITLTLGEHGKFPLFHKASVLALANCLRMEQGTENISVIKAFNSMKRENHPWLQNVYRFYVKLG